MANYRKNQFCLIGKHTIGMARSHLQTNQSVEMATTKI